MARDLNKIMLIGRVGSDPDMRFTSGGSAFVRFRMAVSRPAPRGAGGGNMGGGPGDRPQEETEWFTVVAWNKLAETCNQYVTKGQRIYVDGRISTRSWEGREGQRMFEVQVTANDVMFLDSRTKSFEGGGGPMMDDADESDLDDLPF